MSSGTSSSSRFPSVRLYPPQPVGVADDDRAHVVDVDGCSVDGRHGNLFNVEMILLTKPKPAHDMIEFRIHVLHIRTAWRWRRCRSLQTVKHLGQIQAVKVTT